MGTTIEPQLSHQFKATFDRHARQPDIEGAEPYMTEDDFVNAIAPKDEDYVGVFRIHVPPCSHLIGMVKLT